MKSQQIDVLIPVYNCEKYIEKCLDSLLNQTYKNINIIVNNNGSTDGTGRILDEYANRYNNIIVYYTKNEDNISKARNFLIEKISSDYFTFFDADDYAEEEYIETLYKLLIASGADVSVCAKCRHGENKNVNLKKKNKNLNRVLVWGKTEAIAEMISSKLFNGTVYAKLFKKEILCDAVFDENIHYGEDLDFCYSIMKNCNKVVYTQKQLYHYIVRKGSIVTSKFNPKKLSCLYCYDKLIDQVKNNKTLYICAMSMKGLIATELLYYIWRDKYKNKELKNSLKNIIKESIPYIKQNKRLSKLYRALPSVWWLTKMF